MGRDAVRRQGATRRGLNARNEEQRRRRAAAWLSRVRSGVTQKVGTVVCTEVSRHQAFLAELSGQLPEVGSRGDQLMPETSMPDFDPDAPF